MVESEEADQEQVEYTAFRPTYIYDISQTDGEPMPLEDIELNSNTSVDLLQILKDYSPYRIIETSALNKDYFWKSNEKQVVLAENFSNDDKAYIILQYLIRESYDYFDKKTERDLSETFVESVAYMVADYFNLDTSNKSFNNITYWTKGDAKVIVKLGDKIQKSAKDLIDKLESYSNSNIGMAA